MNSKTITADVVSSYGEKLAGNYENAIRLAKSVKELHIMINQIQAEFTENKKNLGILSKEFFNADLSKKDPEIVGNYDYPLESGTVTVNFKIDGKPFETIKDKPAHEVLQSIFGEHTEKLFGSIDEIHVNETQSKLVCQARKTPELFRVSIKREALPLILREHPGSVEVEVIDLQKYAELYPESVTKKTYATFKPGFLETLSKIDNTIKKAARNLIKDLLKNTLQTAVICGPRIKK